VRYPAARKPRPPALLTAAASAGVDGPPAIGAAMIGIRFGNTLTMMTPLPDKTGFTDDSWNRCATRIR
jgi:hypothetical protein